jgi:hypothetical protein
MTRLFVGAGRKAGIRPGGPDHHRRSRPDVAVGRGDQIADNFSLVDVPNRSPTASSR